MLAAGNVEVASRLVSAQRSVRPAQYGQPTPTSGMADGNPKRYAAERRHRRNLTRQELEETQMERDGWVR
ncbi:hypothetical protein A9W99_07250 [Mycobacterium sp. 1164966.3]|nr:hypothetical protein A9W99_07250 [Mycobacterium sp. 1164966.3]